MNIELAENKKGGKEDDGDNRKKQDLKQSAED